MASIRDLKQDINFVIGDIIDAALIQQDANPDADVAATEAIVDDSIVVFDELIAKVNDKSVENRKAHLKSVRTDLETKGGELIERINKL
ncbi:MULTISPECIES: hypothetical protein [Nonlabens]|uniref:Uncharacterized protein n=2 Tax=Nonlabens TaxID=363408 RepID=A0A084JYF8_NONUL|nr:hypothetical protein [Nonlabens ulvanivorans]MBF4985918.1 hypothetical protein [Nonlabens mediterrranea]KEZ93992.1 hypothetical protein IL45_07310 [Nonlabens ulvanivorans]PRX14611.1 hypothetical protein LY02_01643 [Nonlabens ulvanivorans]WOI22845.1 hypothetical protein R1T42_00055 [Nonlabens ulvanivorans]GAK76926.1 hypothetical protein JCM19296_2530 [Nonlabens ulvanivorans]